MKLKYTKPNILVSACLNFASCRYDGAMINEKFLKLLEPYVTFIPVCPEVEIGLGIPRETIRLVREGDDIRLKENKLGRDLTNDMIDFSKKYVDNLNHIHGFVFKSKSPSCGVKDTKVYESMKKGSASRKTSGLFVREVLNSHGNYPIIDDGRLNDFNIREHFLSRIFLLAHFDEISKKQSLKALQDFHSINKTLLMSYNQTGQKRLGNIVAKSKQEDILNTLDEYRSELIDITTKMASSRSKINVFLYTFGQLSHNLSKEEKAFVLDTLVQYQNGQIPFSTLLVLLKVHAVRHAEKKVLSQSFFNPFPEALIQVRDSGKQII